MQDRRMVTMDHP